MRTVVLAFLLSRALLFAATLALPPEREVAGTPAPWLADRGSVSIFHRCRALDSWLRNDGVYYLQIAGLGYDAPAEARHVKEGFFPLYALAVRGGAALVRPLTGSDDNPPGALVPYLVAGIVISNACSLIALLLLVRLGSRWLGRDKAVRGGVAMAVQPFGFLLSCFLSEPLFLALVLGTFAAGAAGRFLVAGLLGGGAAATRILGVVLLPALGVLALGRGGGPAGLLERWSRLLPIPLGAVLVLVAQGYATGSPWIYFRVQSGFGHERFPTLDGIAGILRADTWMPFEPLRDGLQALVLACAAVLLAGQVVLTLRRQLPWEWLAYSVPMVVFPVLAGALISFPRYATVLFPLFLVLGAWLPGRGAGLGLAAASSLLQVWLFRTWEAHVPLVI